MSTQSVGERIAERFYDVASTDPETIQRLAALIDQELLAAPKILGSETPIAPGLPREQTGEALAESIIDAIYEKWDIGNYDVVKDLFTDAPLSEIIAQIVPLIPSPDSRSTPTEEKQNPSVAPLVEALTEISKGAGAFDLDPLQHATNCITEMKAIAIDALAQAGQEHKE